MTSNVPDFCREGCYWDCGHRAPLTVEDRLHRAFEPSEATREALDAAMRDAEPGDEIRVTPSGVTVNGLWRGPSAKITRMTGAR